MSQRLSASKKSGVSKPIKLCLVETINNAFRQLFFADLTEPSHYAMNAMISNEIIIQNIYLKFPSAYFYKHSQRIKF